MRRGNRYEGEKIRKKGRNTEKEEGGM